MWKDENFKIIKNDNKYEKNDQKIIFVNLFDKSCKWF